MRNIITLFFLAGIMYLSSCKDGSNDNLVIPPASTDSVSNGSVLLFFQFKDIDGEDRDFPYVLDFSRNEHPVYSMYAGIVYSTTDSLYHLKLQTMDYQMDKFALNLELNSATATGTYMVVDNSSTFTDYSKGKNISMPVSIGSTVEIAHSSYPIDGSMNLSLYYNHKTYPATGSFKIFPH